MRVLLAFTLVLWTTAAMAQEPEEHQHHAMPSAQAIGSVHFENSGSRAAQVPFQRGIALLHSFAYDDAARSFRATQRADPSFAMAYWGEAMTYSHMAWGEEDTAAAYGALRRLGATPAARLAKAKTPRERAYGAAFEAYYQRAPIPVRLRAFADSMRAVAARYPADLDATAFAALAMVHEAYRGELPPVERQAAQDEAIALAERVFRASPNHPGGAHYLIHASDSPDRAAHGLAAARAYAGIAPALDHALHMPSHIFVQTGLWPDLSASNERAWAASRAHAARAGDSPARLSFHALAWLTYGYLEQGRLREARGTVDTAVSVLRGVTIPIGEPDARYAASWQSFMFAAESGDWSAFRDPWDGTPPDTSTPRAVTFSSSAAYQSAIVRAMRGDTISPAAAWLRAHAATPAGAQWAVVRRGGLLELDALAATLRGDTAREIALLTRAAAAADSAGALIGPPAMLLSHELLGAALLAAHRPAEAAAAYERELQLTPNRSSSLLGLARAKAAAGDATAAAAAYGRLLGNWQRADPDRPELAEARRGAAAVQASAPR